jgi:hypothetical protein
MAGCGRLRGRRPEYEERPSATLLIPGNLAGPILASLTQAVQELDKKLREQVQLSGWFLPPLIIRAFGRTAKLPRFAH